VISAFSFQPFSFLEVGTGFHPELTGRMPFQYFSFQCFSFLEIVLGMSRAEIRQKFDGMVALVSWLCLRSGEQPTDWGLAEFSGVV